MQEPQNSKFAFTLGITCGIIAFAVVAVFITWSVIVGNAWKHANDPVTDETKYPELLAELRRLNLATHFPEQCPENTIGFYFAPGFLQAPIVLQLRVRASQSMIDQIERTIPKSIINTDSAEQPIDSNCTPGPYVFWDLKETEHSVHDIPESFEYWNHHGIASSNYDGKVSWNHGAIDGIAIDRKNLEILYYSECW